MTADTHTDDGINANTNMVRGTLAEGRTVTVYMDSVHDSFETVEGEITEAEYHDPEAEDAERPEGRKFWSAGNYPDPWVGVTLETTDGKARSFAYTVGEDDQVKELLNEERTDGKTPTLGDIMGVVVDTASHREERTDADGAFCMNCEAFIDHFTPVNTGHATTGDSGCPHCLEAEPVRAVVHEVGDDRSVTGGYVRESQRDHGGSITLEAARAIAGDGEADEDEAAEVAA